MKTALVTGMLLFLAACGPKPPNNTINAAPPATTPASAQVGSTPLPTPFVPKNGLYNGHGTVTRVSNDLGSIEIEHDEIPNMMPAMTMEFYVKDKSILSGIFAADEVNFVIEYKHPEEKITSITKVKKAKKDE